MASLLLPLSADALARQEQDQGVRPAFGLFRQDPAREDRRSPGWGRQIQQDERGSSRETERNRGYPPGRQDRSPEERSGNRGMPPGLFAPRLRDAREDRGGLSPDEAAREIQSRHGGRVLSVQPDGSGYRVKMLKDGEVRIYQVSP